MRVDYDTRTIYLRQSGLEDFLLCPERARRKWFEDLPDETNDAAATGTAVHAAIEWNLKDRRDNLGSHSTARMIETAKNQFDYLERQGIRYVKGTYDDAMQFIETGVRAWRDYIEPMVAVDDSLLLEWNFDVPFMIWQAAHDRADGFGDWPWQVRLTGTADAIDRFRIWDWKHAGQQYRQHEKQRWGVQATAYAHAAVSEGLFGWPVDFSFAVIKKLKAKLFAEPIPIRRYQSHVEWLRRQVAGLLTMWDQIGEEGPWPLVDSHFLCSEKWCPAWATCKGAVVGAQEFAWKPA